MSGKMNDDEKAKAEQLNNLNSTCYCPGPTCSGCEKMIDKLFSMGADWSTKYWREKTHVLVDALRSCHGAMGYAYDDHADQYYINVQEMINEALKKWRGE